MTVLSEQSQENKQKSVWQGITYSAPIPPPAHFEQYQKILPGAADRILRMAENQAQHRQELENKRHLLEEKSLNNNFQLNSRNFDQERLGQIFAFIISMSSIAAGVILILLGNNIIGTVFGGVPLIGIVGKFLKSGADYLIKKYQKINLKHDY